VPPTWLGIDFSGDADMWSAGCRRSNVWIATAEARGGGTRLALADLRRVQELPGDGPPFERLAALLARGEHRAAGLDAPCALPASHGAGESHAALLARAAAVPREGRPFPRGEAFVRGMTGLAPPLSPPRPYRGAEARWRARGVNVRSTLWAGARGGAPMTAACLTLLHAAGVPVWPFAAEGPGLAVEAFPAAQLAEWRLPFERYGAASQRPARRVIALALRARIDLGPFEPVLASSADALDAVLCLFGAVAVTEGRLADPPGAGAGVEGWIAVHR
jgi:hypothetical protein